MHKDVHSLQASGEWSYLARAKSHYLEASEPLRALSHLFGGFESEQNMMLLIRTFFVFPYRQNKSSARFVVPKNPSQRSQIRQGN